MAYEPTNKMSAAADPAPTDPVVVAADESVPAAPAEVPAADPPADVPAAAPADAPSLVAEVAADAAPVVAVVERLAAEAEVAGAKVVADVQAAAPVVTADIIGKLEMAFPAHAGMIAAMKRWFRDELALYHNGKNNIEREEGNP